MSAQRQSLQQEEPKARPYRAGSPVAAMHYLELTAEPGSALDSTASNGTESDLLIPLLFGEPSRRNNESLSNSHTGQSHRPKSLRPFILSIMAFKQDRKFSTITSVHHRRRLQSAVEKEGQFSLALTRLYLGIAAAFSNDRTALIALAINDGIYLTDFSVKHLDLSDGEVTGRDVIVDYVLKEVQDYEHKNLAKFIGAGLSATLSHVSKTLCSRLWLDLDIVPITVVNEREEDEDEENRKGEKNFWNVKRVDEQADSMVRKCVMYFGPSQAPLLQVDFRGFVQTDVGFQACLTDLQNYKDTCSTPTWETMMTYAEKLRRDKTRIAFFSSTLQGDGVAPMRHALVRFARRVGVNVSWYVPKPLPTALRITKNIQNVLQGVSPPSERITSEEKKDIIHWITENAYRYWLSEAGPLRPVEEGGAHVIIVSAIFVSRSSVQVLSHQLSTASSLIELTLTFVQQIDDPQMAGLIPLIKRFSPDRPVLYRSHIEIRSYLIAKDRSAQADIWEFLWSNIQSADMYISDPIPAFVPHTVPRTKVAYLPATADWLDGLNKPMKDWDAGYYVNIYNISCHAHKIAELHWPARKYIIQIARFESAKGVPTVVDSYAEFRRQCEAANMDDIPQLVLCDNQSADAPDPSIVYDQTLNQIMSLYPELMEDISVMRLEPNDQLLNTLISKAFVVLQLSTSEGFEVRVSEALHAGRPVVATKAGGIPLQVKDSINGFLVEPGDWRAVAHHLMDLFTDDDLYERMSYAASTGVSDEVGTVSNALCWFYLASKWADLGLEKSGMAALQSHERWVYDMAREEANYPYSADEDRLPRCGTEATNVDSLDSGSLS
ncbi:related to trehalose synthase [Fusarium torulosum]|uniref:Related to trehalose synthase n=1 Tax=Fusarium torulosum TaxID=33205 RepID=A0AAE8SI72_9HYPO|nr:related to trehalose synthase [Fusarium torulosum]